jgi:hypothetical protein
VQQIDLVSKTIWQIDMTSQFGSEIIWQVDLTYSYIYFLDYHSTCTILATSYRIINLNLKFKFGTWFFNSENFDK